MRSKIPMDAPIIAPETIPGEPGQWVVFCVVRAILDTDVATIMNMTCDT
jgi:hypothetical protein